MMRMPDLDGNVNRSPHLVILGAGASLAAFPSGDRNGVVLPLMNNLVDVAGLAPILQRCGIDPDGQDFESVYSRLAASERHRQLLSKLENVVYEYFARMRLPDHPTIYDYLLLCLRGKDMVATFNWDPLLVQAFRRNRHVAEMPKVVFLHGNVAIGLCPEHHRCGYQDDLCGVCGCRFDRTRLLYPVAQKNYSDDPFIASEWAKLRMTLHLAYYLTIFGYSAPVTDVEAKVLLLDTWKNNPTRELAEIDIVDIKPEHELRATWDDFIVAQHYGVSVDIFESWLFGHPRRSCDSFASGTLQMEPWHLNPFPRFGSLHELQNWVQPLVAEEARYDSQGTSFSRDPCPPPA